MNEKSTSEQQQKLRALPSVDRLLQSQQLAEILVDLPHALVVEVAREVLAELRQEIAAGGEGISPQDLPGEIVRRLADLSVSSLRHVINATGIIIHTNLGRAPLSQAALLAMRAAAAYSNLEYDLGAGVRGSRYAHAAPLLARLTGAEDALVVNNAAAALFFVLSAFAQGRELILSRGQAVEIGGGFRIPDIMAQSGALLREVGTTNRTYSRDYEAAIGAQTAGLLRVHASNFRVVGFTTQPSISDLAQLASSHGIMLIDDVGSGALLPTAPYGLSPEPLVQDSVRAGADIVIFSGDKLLGGPQAGLIVGKKTAIATLRKHPLARALRVDKVTYAGLEATLLHYLRGEAISEVPVWKMIAASETELAARARRIASELIGLPVHVLPGRSAVGGGSLPGETLPTWLVALASQGVEQAAALGAPDVDESEESAPHEPIGHRNGFFSPSTLTARLRRGRPAVVARVEKSMLLIDLRTVQPDEEDELITAVRAAWQDVQSTH